MVENRDVFRQFNHNDDDVKVNIKQTLLLASLKDHVCIHANGERGEAG